MVREKIPPLEELVDELMQMPKEFLQKPDRLKVTMQAKKSSRRSNDHLESGSQHHFITEPRKPTTSLNLNLIVDGES